MKETEPQRRREEAAELPLLSVVIFLLTQLRIVKDETSPQPPDILLGKACVQQGPPIDNKAIAGHYPLLPTYHFDFSRLRRFFVLASSHAPLCLIDT